MLSMSKQKIPQKMIPWLEAKKRHHLSDLHIQMARELGMNPKKLGKLANHKQEPWKLPLPQFIEKCYLKSFKRTRPEKVVSLTGMLRTSNSKPAKPAMPGETKSKVSPELATDVTAHLPVGEPGLDDIPF
jgi:hypothetical protein